MRKLLTVLMVWFLLAPAAGGAGELRIFIWSEYMDEEAMPAAFDRASAPGPIPRVGRGSGSRCSPWPPGSLGTYSFAVTPASY